MPFSLCRQGMSGQANPFHVLIRRVSGMLPDGFAMTVENDAKKF